MGMKTSNHSQSSTSPNLHRLPFCQNPRSDSKDESTTTQTKHYLYSTLGQTSDPKSERHLYPSSDLTRLRASQASDRPSPARVDQNLNFSLSLNSCTLFSKIEKSDLENSKHPKILYPIIFQYENFYESEKSKFRDNLIYFLS
jgi:hypothetical protein